MLFSANPVVFWATIGVFEKFKNLQGKPWDWADTWTVTLAGFLIVFIVLILLIIIFNIFGKIMEKVNEKEAKKATEPVLKKSETGVSDETAAVITAAVAEANGGKKFFVKSIKEDKK
jgi:sodium pump decarboxylase gamma subunit